MNDSTALICLCSDLHGSDGARPFGAAEWRRLSARLSASGTVLSRLCEMSGAELAEAGIFRTDAERILCLFEHCGRVEAKVAEYAKQGIRIVTQADEAYPPRFGGCGRLNAPVLFYYAGELSLAAKNYIGIVGSRRINASDAEYTRRLAHRCVRGGYGVVSGGAVGTDSAAEEASIGCGGEVLELPAQALYARLRTPFVAGAVSSGRMLIMSAKRPEQPFYTAYAMMRNRLIYAQSCATVVVKADYKKGGSWAGAEDNLRNGWCEGYVRFDACSRGNAALISMGARIADGEWQPRGAYSAQNRQLSVFDEQN